MLPAGRQERMEGPNGRFSWARPRGGVPVFHPHSKGYNSVTWLYLTRVGWETDLLQEKESKLQDHHTVPEPPRAQFCTGSCSKKHRFSLKKSSQ